MGSCARFVNDAAKPVGRLQAEPDSSGFPPKAVLGPAFTPGERRAGARLCLYVCCQPGLPGSWPPRGSHVNVADAGAPVSHEVLPRHNEPGVNAGPNTGCAGRGRKRPQRVPRGRCPIAAGRGGESQRLSVTSGTGLRAAIPARKDPGVNPG